MTQEDQEQEGVKVHRVERSQSFVRRSLRLPEYADLSKVQVGVCALYGQASRLSPCGCVKQAVYMPLPVPIVCPQSHQMMQQAC